MKFVGVMDEDPFDPDTWSGSSRYFFSALQSAQALHTAVPAAVPARVRRYYQLLSVQPDTARWRFRFHLNTSYYGALTRQVRRQLDRIDSADYDAVLQVGAWYDVPSVSTKPVVSYHDGSLAARCKSPYGYPPVAARHIRLALEHEQNVYRKLSVIFPMSRWLADSFISDYGVDHKKVIPIGAGVNLPRIQPASDKDYRQPRVLFVGKDFQRKGGADLLAAFAVVRKEHPDAELTVIGPVLTDVPEGVRCLGSLSKREPADVDRLLMEYARASVFVLPSLYEPFGVSFGEAMAHYCPCIGTNVCAMPEIIDHGRTGFVVPPGDVTALAGRIVELLKEPEMARSFGRAGYEKYRTSLTWEAVTAKLVAAARMKLGAG